MRKIGLLAFGAAMLIALPALSADKPIYSMWSPSYPGMTRAEFQAAALEDAKEQERQRNLMYSLLGLAGVALVGIGLRYLRR